MNNVLYNNFIYYSFRPLDKCPFVFCTWIKEHNILKYNEVREIIFYCVVVSCISVECGSICSWLGIIILLCVSHQQKKDGFETDQMAK